KILILHHRNSKSLSVESLRNIEQKTHLSFEPFSANILQRVNEARGIKEKNAIFESVMNDDRAMIINAVDGFSTKIFPGNKGPKTSTWEQTKQMAYELNKVGISVVFLPEHKNLSSADALLKSYDKLFGEKKYRISDFKYVESTNANTVQEELIDGFNQANTIVLKLKNMDGGLFLEVLKYIKRNEERRGYHYGDILLQNKYGKTVLISRSDIRTNRFIRKIKGFL
ncbi:MAG: hypothetical protein II401_09085, partial [Bacteroidales bacterium]|nr:hypothetical protein [Bacteroidales bacterium]